jgi:hypothetical protein
MAKGGVIGNLRVNLGLDSAQFQAGVAKVGSSLDRIAKKAAVFGAAVGASMVGVAGALSVAVRNTINDADDLGKAAQKFGVGVEELSRLKHAADLSGVSLDGLGTGLSRLSNAMQETANGAKNTASRAFQALGIEVKNADGSLRSSSLVMIDIADRFSRMQDGAQKTALAMAIFGRSGTELIPMLNAGKVGLTGMMEEADRLGIVIDTNTAKAAENFNDNLTRLARVKDGLTTQVTASLLPALELFSEKLIELASNEEWLSKATGFATDAFKFIVQEISQVTIFAARLNVELASIAEALSRFNNYDFSGAWRVFQEGQAASAKMAEDLKRQMDGILSGSAVSQGGIQRRIDEAFGSAGASAGEKFTARFETAVKSGAGRVKAAVDPMVAEAARIFEATRTPLETYQMQIARLNELLAAGAINQDTYNRAVIDAQSAFDQAENAGKATESVFTSIGQTITQSFGSAIQGLIDGSKSAIDVIKDLLSQLAQLLINRAFQALIGGLFGGGGADPWAGLRFPGNAMGTSNWRGGMTWVGERGPELVNLPRGSQVIPNHELGGGRGTEINIIDQAGTEKRTMRRRGPDGREMVDIIIERVKGSFADGGFDGVLGTRFGAVPNKVRR